MYKLIEYSSNYSKTTGSLWFYSKDKAANFNTNISSNDCKSFGYHAKFLRIQLLNSLQIKLMEFKKMQQLLSH